MELGSGELSRGSDVWIEHETEAWLPAKIEDVGREGGLLEVRTEYGELLTVQKEKVKRCFTAGCGAVPDLLSLGDFSEEALLHNVRTRFANQQIYTAIGCPILISVNPYKNLDNYYDEATVQKYRQAGIAKERGETVNVEPHLFSMAQQAYSALLRDRRAQSIIITGESGAGKTEATKHILKYLAGLHACAVRASGDSVLEKEALNLHAARENEKDDGGGRPSSAKSTLSVSKKSVEQQVLFTNPILEAFGNAKTVRNDNSSRFGKFIDVHFDAQGRLTTAVIRSYLLEKCRIVRQQEGERNYHIFFQLLRALRKLEPALFAKLHLEGYPLDSFPYVDNLEEGVGGGEGSDYSGERVMGSVCYAIDDFAGLRDTLRAMRGLDFSEDEMEMIFALVSAVLHIGNLSFEERRSEKDGALLHPESLSALEAVVSLLSVDRDGFLEVFRVRRRSDPLNKGKFIDSPRTIEQAEYVRDAVAKAVYSRLFAWLVERVNHSLQRGGGKSGGSAISGGMARGGSSSSSAVAASSSSSSSSSDQHLRLGLLDIYGFEVFDENSFEQLCINFANEKLQQQFNQHMFKLEQAKYAEEDILWEHISFRDNDRIISALEGSPYGVFRHIDSECSCPDGSDSSLLQKICDYPQKLTGPAGGGGALSVSSLSVSGLGQGRGLPKQQQAAGEAEEEAVVSRKVNKWEKKFVVKHYAGEVAYSVEGFVEKNKDPMQDSVVNILGSSANWLLKELFASDKFASNSVAALQGGQGGAASGLSQGAGGSRRSPGRQRGQPGGGARGMVGGVGGVGAGALARQKPVSVGEAFRRQLTALVETLNRTNPLYIRCIKPNNEKMALKMDSISVLSQLRYAGMLESIRIRRAGYSVRRTFREFFQRYRWLDPAFRPSRPSEGGLVSREQVGSADLCRKILALLETKVKEAEKRSSRAHAHAHGGAAAGGGRERPGHSSSSGGHHHDGGERERSWIVTEAIARTFKALPEKPYQIGRTRVFMKEQVRDILELCLAQIQRQAQARLAARARGMIVRTRVALMKHAVVVVQGLYRMVKAKEAVRERRRVVEAQRRACRVIGGYYRLFEHAVRQRWKKETHLQEKAKLEAEKQKLAEEVESMKRAMAEAKQQKESLDHSGAASSCLDESVQTAGGKITEKDMMDPSGAPASFPVPLVSAGHAHLPLHDLHSTGTGGWRGGVTTASVGSQAADAERMLELERILEENAKLRAESLEFTKAREENAKLRAEIEEVLRLRLEGESCRLDLKRDAETKHEELVALRHEASSERARHETELAELHRRHEDAMRMQERALSEVRARHENEMANVERRVQSERERVEVERERESRRLRSDMESVERRERDSHALYEEQKTALERRLHEAEGAAMKARREAERVQEELRIAQEGATKSLNDERQRRESETSTLRAHLEASESERFGLSEQLTSLSLEKQSLQSTVAEKDKKIAELVAEQASLREKLATQTERAEAFERRVKEAEVKAQDAERGANSEGTEKRLAHQQLEFEREKAAALSEKHQALERQVREIQERSVAEREMRERELREMAERFSSQKETLERQLQELLERLKSAEASHKKERSLLIEQGETIRKQAQLEIGKRDQRLQQLESELHQEKKKLASSELVERLEKEKQQLENRHKELTEDWCQRLQLLGEEKEALKSSMKNMQMDMDEMKERHKNILAEETKRHHDALDEQRGVATRMKEEHEYKMLEVQGGRDAALTSLERARGRREDRDKFMASQLKEARERVEMLEREKAAQQAASPSPRDAAAAAVGFASPHGPNVVSFHLQQQGAMGGSGQGGFLLDRTAIDGSSSLLPQQPNQQTIVPVLNHPIPVPSYGAASPVPVPVPAAVGWIQQANCSNCAPVHGAASPPPHAFQLQQHHQHQVIQAAPARVSLPPGVSSSQSPRHVDLQYRQQISGESYTQARGGHVNANANGFSHSTALANTRRVGPSGAGAAPKDPGNLGGGGPQWSPRAGAPVGASLRQRRCDDTESLGIEGRVSPGPPAARRGEVREDIRGRLEKRDRLVPVGNRGVGG